MTARDPPRSRVLIGAGSYADAAAALDLAKALLRERRAALAGLLVEEAAIAELALQSGQRLVTSSGALVPPPEAARFRSILESEAKAFRRLLASVAQAAALDWSFARETGELVTCACRVVHRQDILLLGYRPMMRRRGRVLIVGGAVEETGPAPELARDLATALGTQAARLEAETAEAAIAQVDRAHAAAVVVDMAAGPLDSAEDLRRLLAAARCPVVVTGAERLQALPDAGGATG